MDVFLKGVFRFSRAVIPHMQRQGGGSIVNIGSVLGLKAALAFPVHPYAVAKAGVGDAHEDDRRALREGRHPRQLRRARSYRDATVGIPADGPRGANADDAAWTTGGS